MVLKKYSYIVLMIVALLWTGCKSERENEPMMGNPFSLSICLPTDEVHATRMCNHRRALGDPGTTESFELPHYIYIFIVKEVSENTWKVWEIIEKTPNDANWEKKCYVGTLIGANDSVYEYTENIILPLVDQRFNGRVYAIASAKKLTFDATISKATGTESTEAELLDLKFLTSPDSIQANVQNIYSTPYNYVVDDKYYGSFSSITHQVPYVYLMLYHVAAKVDINWNVPDSVRIKANPAEAVRLTYMKACNMFNGNAYCFKPMRMTSTDSVTIITPADEGLWWEGRSYFYTIPYTTPGRAGHFPLQMKMGTNDSTKYYKPTIYLNIENDTTFVPWLRVNFNLTQPLTEGSTDI